MLGRLQGMGVKVIVGDIVLDRSAFDVQGTTLPPLMVSLSGPTTPGQMPCW